MRLAIFVVAVGVLGCGESFTSNLPDGGKAWIHCNATPLTVAVRVVDKAGDPVPGAFVNITNEQNKKALTAQTDPRGVFTLSQGDVGPGLTQVNASYNGFDTQLGSVEFICSGCSCAASPSNLVLRLQ